MHHIADGAVGAIEVWVAGGGTARPRGVPGGVRAARARVVADGVVRPAQRGRQPGFDPDGAIEVWLVRKSPRGPRGCLGRSRRCGEPGSVIRECVPYLDLLGWRLRSVA